MADWASLAAQLVAEDLERTRRARRATVLLFFARHRGGAHLATCIRGSTGGTIALVPPRQLGAALDPCKCNALVLTSAGGLAAHFRSHTVAVVLHHCVIGVVVERQNGRRVRPLDRLAGLGHLLEHGVEAGSGNLKEIFIGSVAFDEPGLKLIRFMSNVPKQQLLIDRIQIQKQ